MGSLFTPSNLATLMLLIYLHLYLPNTSTRNNDSGCGYKWVWLPCEGGNKAGASQSCHVRQPLVNSLCSWRGEGICHKMVDLAQINKTILLISTTRYLMS